MTATCSLRLLHESSSCHEAASTPAYSIPRQAQSMLVEETSETAPGGDQINAISRGRSPLPVVPPVALPSHTQVQPHFHVLQKWQGTVSEVTGSTFIARLFDLIETSDEEVAEFDLEEVSRGDLALVAPGAVFYWSVGYRTEPSGERSRSSVLVFRRLPSWSDRDLRRAADRAEELRIRFGW